MEPRRRPLGIWIIVGLQLLNGAVWLADVLLGARINVPALASLVESSDAIRVLVIAWAAIMISASVLLWRLSRRGWALMMVLVGISLAVNLTVWWRTPGDVNWISMGLSALTAFYLNSAAVRTLFLRRHDVPRITLSDRGAP